MSTGLTFFLLSGLLAAQLVSAQDPIPVAEGEGLCDAIHNSGECAAAIEAHQIPLSRGRVRRDGAALRLRLTSGQVLSVANDTVGRGALFYSFLGFCPRLGYYALWAQRYEGHFIRLVNARTGWSVLVDDMPTVSPDARRFVTLALEMEVRLNTDIVVWRVDGDTLRREWEFQPEYSDPHDVRWLSNRSFEFAHSRSSPTIAVVVDTAEIGAAGQWVTRLGP